MECLWGIWSIFTMFSNNNWYVKVILIVYNYYLSGSEAKVFKNFNKQSDCFFLSRSLLVWFSSEFVRILFELIWEFELIFSFVFLWTFFFIIFFFIRFLHFFFKIFFFSEYSKAPFLSFSIETLIFYNFFK